MKTINCINCRFYHPLPDGEKWRATNIDGHCNITLPPILRNVTLGRSGPITVAKSAGCSLGQPIPQDGAQ